MPTQDHTKSTLPEPESLNVAFLRYIGLRQLHVPISRATGMAYCYADRPSSDDIIWVRASGAATLLSFTVYRQTYRPDFTVPYNVAWVELDEGPRLISTIAAEDPASLRIGMLLTADFEPSGRLIFHAVDTNGPIAAVHQTMKATK